MESRVGERWGRRRKGSGNGNNYVKQEKIILRNLRKKQL